MPPQLTKQQWRELKIYNPYNLARRGAAIIFLDYNPATYGRASSSAHWQVVGITFATDPSGAWYNYGRKTFYVNRREDKQPQLELAMNWARENYGISEWEHDPFGGYQIKGTMGKAINELEGGQ